MQKFELSLATGYVASWTIVEAVREFFQNALDQEAQEPDNKMFCTYDVVEEKLSIGNKSSVLTANTLLLGTTTKKDSDCTIGQFGEGYKVATLVALREGKEVVFYNYGKREIWKPRIVKSRKYQADVLTFFVDTYVWKKVPNDNLTIEISGVTPREYVQIIATNLHLWTDISRLCTSYGNILLGEEHKGKVFVNGLYVTTNKEMKFGYDVKPKYLPLDRDRRAVSSFDLVLLTSKMWAESKDNRINDLLKDGAADVRYLHWASGITAKLKEEIYTDFKSTYGEKAIPVSNQQELQNVQKYYKERAAVMVSDSYKGILTSSSSYRNEQLADIQEDSETKMLKWLAKVSSKLSDGEVDELLLIMDVEREEWEDEYVDSNC